MSTTASAKNYSASQIQRGPADLWVGVAKPANGTHVITIDPPSGTPDATANPSAIHLGLLSAPAVLNWTPKPDDEKADQDTSTVAVFDNDEELMLEASLSQTDYEAVLQNCMPGGVFSDGTKQGVTMGRGANILRTPVPICAIAASADPRYLWQVALLYAATPVSAIKTTLGRTKTNIWTVQFKAISDLTRTSGDRLGSIYKTN